MKKLSLLLVIVMITSIVSFTPAFASERENLALNKPVTASAEHESYPAANAVDDDIWSTWIDGAEDPDGWIYVDLGATYDIKRVQLTWEWGYAEGYKLQVSDDAVTWTDIYSTDSGDGGIDNIRGLNASGRYVKMQGVSYPEGREEYSLTNFEVYDFDPNEYGPVMEEIADITAYEGSYVQFRATAEDGDGDHVAFYAEGLPEGAYFLPEGNFEWQPDFDQAGTYEVTIFASDAISTDSVVVKIEVLDNDPDEIPLGKKSTLYGAALDIPEGVWTLDISDAPVLEETEYHFSSEQFLASEIYSKAMGNVLRPVFGTYWEGIPNGIPYNVVDNNTPTVKVNIEIAEESEHDPGTPGILTIPMPEDPIIENTYDPTSENPGEDRHLLLYNKDDGTLTEVYNIWQDPDTGEWHAYSIAVFSPDRDYQRPIRWTSSDAAGLAVLPGLVRYDEIEAGEINHAIRVTFRQTAAYHIPPASHKANAKYRTYPRTVTNPQDKMENPVFPNGARLRLKADFDISGYSETNQIILKALKKYGMIVADNGMNFALCGVNDYRWDDGDLGKLKKISSDMLEVVDTGEWGPGYTVTASTDSVSVGEPVTLTIELNRELNEQSAITVSILDDLGVGVTGPELKLTQEDTVVTCEYTPTAPGKRVLTFSNDVHVLNEVPIIIDVVGEELTFGDVDSDDWFSDAVGFASSRGIVQGVGHDKFEPATSVKRADFLIMVMRAFGITPATDLTDNFADAGDKYYTGYLAAAKKLGLVSGVGDNLFAPEESISRQDMFVILHRILDRFDELPEGEAGKALESFEDAGKVADYAQEAMSLFTKTGITAGDGTKVMPDKVSTRAEAVQILYNILAD